MSLNDKDIADKLKEFFSGSTVTRTGGKNYANSEEIPLGGGGSDREQIVKNRKQKPNKKTAKNIKYVLRKTVAGVVSIYVCGWQAKCRKVTDLPSGASLGQVTIDSIGTEKYYVSLYYSLSGAFVFQLYDSSGLVNEYSETGLGGYELFAGINGINGVPFIDSYWDYYVYCVGFGRFICNYGGDSNTSLNNVTGTNPATGSASGRIRFIVDLRKISAPFIQKYIHSTESYVRTFYPGPGGVTIIDRSYQWAGLEVFASQSSTAPSYLTSSTVGAAFPVITCNTNTRVVYRVSQNGSLGFGEIFYANTEAPPDGYYLYVKDVSNDNIYLVLGNSFSGSGGVTDNRFIASLSQNAALQQDKYCDFSRTGFNFIETQPPDPNATPPIPQTTLYRIERSRTKKRVTVQLLNLQLKKRSSRTVAVYPPDINKTETSNFGTVLAASYG